MNVKDEYEKSVLLDKAKYKKYYKYIEEYSELKQGLADLKEGTMYSTYTLEELQSRLKYLDDHKVEYVSPEPSEKTRLLLEELTLLNSVNYSIPVSVNEIMLEYANAHNLPPYQMVCLIHKAESLNTSNIKCKCNISEEDTMFDVFGLMPTHPFTKFYAVVHGYRTNEVIYYAKCKLGIFSAIYYSDLQLVEDKINEGRIRLKKIKSPDEVNITDMAKYLMRGKIINIESENLSILASDLVYDKVLYDDTYFILYIDYRYEDKIIKVVIEKFDLYAPEIINNTIQGQFE